VDLGGLIGPLVIRSQTSITLAGRVVRRDRRSARNPLGEEPEPRAKELLDLALRPADEWPTLSSWLERLLGLDEQESWTILVAGGDLWIPPTGVLEVEGNLILVAGGRIRVEGRALSHARLWRTGEAGNVAAQGNAVLPLTLDEPLRNPLRVPLVFGATTAPLRGARDPRHTWLIGHEGLGRFSAEVLRDPAEAGPAGTASNLRYSLRLEVGPGGGEPWDPPYIERIEVEGLGASAARADHP
jgi:hypothetical protein